MAKKRKGIKKTKSLQGEILKIFQNNPEYTYNYKQISAIMGVKDPSIRKLIICILEDFAEQEVLKQISRGKFQIIGGSTELVGVLQFIQRGGAFFIGEELEEDIYIHPSRTGKAFNGDKVKIRAIKYKGKKEGEVVAIIERSKKEYVGILEKNGSSHFVRPDDKSMPVDFYIDRKHINGAKNGQKVRVKFLSWPSTVKSPIAAVIEVLGKPGDLQVEMHAILSEFGFPHKFSKEVLNESSLINEPNYDIEAKKRKDFRKVFTFTIDPEDAKDFDDALSFQQLKNGHYEIGIHIADVSHYILPGSVLDKEAYLRGNSVYLVDRVVPMLPEKLSNGLCSLRPNENKLTFSAVFEMDDNGLIHNEWFGRTVIYSDVRYTYEQAQNVIEGKKDQNSSTILKINDIAKIIRKKRIENGALNIESQEVKFKLDEQLKPIDVYLKESKEAQQLIEEFMLIANKRVAQFLGKPAKNKKINPIVFRVHDEPNEEKISDLKVILEQYEYQIVREKNKPISSSLNKIMQKAKAKEELHIIGPLIIRAMSKAIYSTENNGHYGLAFDYYTHFTSPIRRYADLLVHRLLQDALDNKPFSASNSLEFQCKHISTTEKQAVEAERASTKYMQVLFLKEKIGQTFKGKITGLTEWGFYVELNENKCEGLVPMRSLEDDHYYYDHSTQKIIGNNTSQTYFLGMEVMVVVKNTNIFKRQIDFVLKKYY